MKTKCVFLDRDGVLNQDTDGYIYRPQDLIIPAGTFESLARLKKAGYLLIVVTNQAGIAKGLYSATDVRLCHEYFQQQCGYLLDDLYFCSHHPDYDSESLLRKPDSLMLEKAIAKYNIDTTHSWLIGDRIRDIEAGQKAGVQTIQLCTTTSSVAHNRHVSTLSEAVSVIFGN